MFNIIIIIIFSFSFSFLFFSFFLFLPHIDKQELIVVIIAMVFYIWFILPL